MENNDLLDYGVALVIVRYLRRRQRQLIGMLNNVDTDYFDALGYSHELEKLKEAELVIKELSVINLEQYKTRRNEKRNKKIGRDPEKA